MKIFVNNVNLYYETHGEGQPIILLHGNSQTHEIFDKLIDELKKQYTVYAIDTRCHGKSDNIKEISYSLMRDDVIEFIKKLNIEKPILYGFSDGGIVGILIAIKEKELLSKLIVSGANVNPDGIKKKYYLFTKLVSFITRNKLFKMMLNEPNISKKELNEIKTPTVVLAGERDCINFEHTKFIADNIKNSKLEIIKNETHGSYIINSEKLYKIMKKDLLNN